MVPNEKSRQDKNGLRWHFHYDYKPLAKPADKRQRLFFWNEDKTESGIAFFSGDRTIAYRKIEDLISKLVSSAALRENYHQTLKFPLEVDDYPFPSEPPER
jgi:hypothetical protein